MKKKIYFISREREERDNFFKKTLNFMCFFIIEKNSFEETTLHFCERILLRRKNILKNILKEKRTFLIEKIN